MVRGSVRGGATGEEVGAEGACPSRGRVEIRRKRTEMQPGRRRFGGPLGRDRRLPPSAPHRPAPPPAVTEAREWARGPSPREVKQRAPRPRVKGPLTRHPRLQHLRSPELPMPCSHRPLVHVRAAQSLARPGPHARAPGWPKHHQHVPLTVAAAGRVVREGLSCLGVRAVRGRPLDTPSPPASELGPVLRAPRLESGS